MTVDEGTAVEAAVIARLEALGAPYRVIECDPALADTLAFCAHYGVALEQSANCIVVASKREPRRYAACLALATTRLDVNRAVKRELAAGKLSFATAEETRAITGMLIGGVTPFGLPDDLPLLVDERVMGVEELWVGGGGRTIKVGVPPEVLGRLPATRVIADLAVPVEA